MMQLLLVKFMVADLNEVQKIEVMLHIDLEINLLYM